MIKFLKQLMYSLRKLILMQLTWITYPNQCLLDPFFCLNILYIFIPKCPHYRIVSILSYIRWIPTTLCWSYYNQFIIQLTHAFNKLFIFTINITYLTIIMVIWTTPFTSYFMKLIIQCHHYNVTKWHLLFIQIGRNRLWSSSLTRIQ